MENVGRKLTRSMRRDDRHTLFSEDINLLIDLSLDMGDKVWFNQLVKLRKSLTENDTQYVTKTCPLPAKVDQKFVNTGYRRYTRFVNGMAMEEIDVDDLHYNEVTDSYQLKPPKPMMWNPISQSYIPKLKFPEGA